MDPSIQKCENIELKGHAWLCSLFHRNCGKNTICFLLKENKHLSQEAHHLFQSIYNYPCIQPESESESLARAAIKARLGCIPGNQLQLHFTPHCSACQPLVWVLIDSDLSLPHFFALIPSNCSKIGNYSIRGDCQ